MVLAAERFFSTLSEITTELVISNNNYRFRNMKAALQQAAPDSDPDSWNTSGRTYLTFPHPLNVSKDVFAPS